MPLNIRDLAVSSPGFSFGERIPDEHAAEHGNTPPVLEISGVPEGAVELAVIMHDPDAPKPRGFAHWLLYGIDPAATRIAAGAGGHREGPNARGERAYFGPRPPAGHGTHHYYFWVYVLNRAVQGEPAREEFLDAYADAVIEQNRLVGTYSA